MAGQNPKNGFYRLLKLGKDVKDIMRAFQHIKKDMIKDCTRREAGK